MVRLRQELLEGSLLQYLLCFLCTQKVCLFTNTTRLELSFIPPLARGKLACSRSHLKHWRAAAALFLAKAKTGTKRDSRLAKHRRAAPAHRKLLLESLIQLAFLVGTNNYGWTHPVWSRSGLAN